MRVEDKDLSVSAHFHTSYGTLLTRVTADVFSVCKRERSVAGLTIRGSNLDAKVDYQSLGRRDSSYDWFVLHPN